LQATPSGQTCDGRIAKWIDGRLGHAARAAVHDARNREIATLTRELERTRDPSIVALAGTPTHARASILIDALRRSIGADA
jgi:hypothetical protein